MDDSSAADGEGTWALADHHVHGVVLDDLDRRGFELLISESGAPAPAGTSHFDAPVGLAIRRWCSPVLGLEPHAAPEQYLEARSALGAAEVNRRLLSGAGLELLVVETGHRSDDVASPAEMAAMAGAPAAEVVRIEAVAEHAAATSSGPAEWRGAFPVLLREAARSAVGLKTIVAYRHGFDLDPARPDHRELTQALDEWFAMSSLGGFRLTSPPLLREVLHEALELAGEEGLVLQVHAGLGDPDLELHRANPAVFTPYVRLADAAGVNLAFLHCYPYHREAGYLAEVFGHVYFDVGCILNYAGPGAGRVLAEALELAPFSKLLYSSDAFGLAELAYLGASQFRRHLGRVLSGYVEHDECSPEDARHISALVSSGNASRIYPLDRAGLAPAMPSLGR